MKAQGGYAIVRLIGFLLLVLIGVAPVPAARAHASLIAAEPADGAILSAAPERLTLVFNEPISPIVLRLIDPKGNAAVLTDVVQRDATLMAKLPPLLDQGSYLLSWRVVSADGHPVAGTVAFSVGQADAGSPAVVKTAPDWPVRGAIWLAKLALYAAMFFGVGGSVFTTWIASARPLPARAEKIIVALLLLGMMAVPFSVGLQGLDALGAPLSALGEAAPWRQGFATSYGSTALIAGSALLMAIVAMTVPPSTANRGLSLAALGGIGLALAASGHAATAAPQWLTQRAVFLHVIAVALWIGSLWPLAASLRAVDADRRQALLRFSRAIPWAIVALLLSGVVLAVVQLARFDALWTTAYGAVFLAKMALVFLLFSLAVANRFLLTPRIEAGDAAAARRLRSSIAMELGLALAIFGIVALWRFTPPPRTTAVAVSEPEFIHFHGEKAMAEITLDPGHVGRSSGTITVWNANETPMTAKAVTLVLSQPAAGIEAIRRDAVAAGANTWNVDDLLIPTPGRWHLRVEILVNDFEKIPLEDEIEIRR
jgi:copper transport protein